MRALITGGAGFVGSSVAVALAERHPDWQLVAADSLYRRGSELNLERLGAAGVEFVHADIRVREDVAGLGEFQAIVDAAAEPAVGADRRPGGRSRMVDVNLGGLQNCLELAARSAAHLIVLSTSRVYPLAGLTALQLREEGERLVLEPEQPLPGVSEHGISEEFPLGGARTLYGASKLAGELLAAEYAESFGITTTVNRCGVIAGPWQLATSEQGVFAHWALSYSLGRPLSYIGWGGTGKQVRDLLHIDDLADLLDRQLRSPGRWAGVTVNVGGGSEVSLSLREASSICRELTGSEMEPTPHPEQRPGDVPLYISDTRRLHSLTDWRPRKQPREILSDTLAWIDSEPRLARVL